MMGTLDLHYFQLHTAYTTFKPIDNYQTFLLLNNYK